MKGTGKIAKFCALLLLVKWQAGPFVAEAQGQAQKQAQAQVNTQVQDQVQNQVQNQYKNQVQDQGQNQVQNQYKSQVQDQGQNQVQNQYKSQVQDQGQNQAPTLEAPKEITTREALERAHLSKDNFFKNKTKINDPFSLRDPFKTPSSLKKREEEKMKATLIEGVFTNLPTIEEVPLADISIIGVLVGKERRALAVIKGGSGETVVLREGMFLGKDNAEIKAILPGGIVLVEKIINVYGQEEYLETVLPISENPYADAKKGDQKNKGGKKDKPGGPEGGQE